MKHLFKASQALFLAMMSTLVVASNAYAGILISDINLSAFNFDVQNYNLGSDAVGLGGDATASGYSNGVSWSISPTNLWSGRTTTDSSFSFSALPVLTDNLHVSADFTITFNKRVDSLLVALSNNASGIDSINFGLTPTDTLGVSFSGTQANLNSAAGGLVLFTNVQSFTVTNVDSNGIFDGYDLAFHVVTTVPVPTSVLLFTTGLIGLLKIARKK